MYILPHISNTTQNISVYIRRTVNRSILGFNNTFLLNVCSEVIYGRHGEINRNADCSNIRPLNSNEILSQKCIYLLKQTKFYDQEKELLEINTSFVPLTNRTARVTNILIELIIIFSKIF